MLCVLLFTVSSALSGLAPTLGWLVAFRVLQGVGGGGLQPSEQSILADTFPPHQRGMAMAVYGVAVVTAPILGPTLGGWITDNFDWRWIFFINIPVGLVSLYLTHRLVEDPPHFHRRDWSSMRVDYIGLGAIAIGLACLQIMLDKGERSAWFDSPVIAALAAVSALAIVFAVIWEWHHKDPMVDIRLLGERNFGLSNVLMFMLGFVLFGSTVMLPLFLQTLLGYTATQAGLVLSPGGLVTMFSMPFVGFLVSRVQPKYLVAFGLMVVGLSLWHMSHFNLHIDYRVAVLARMMQAAGLGFLFVPINASAYGFVPHDKHTQASGLLNLSRNLGGGVGIAITTTLLARHAQEAQYVLSKNFGAGDPQVVEKLQMIRDALAHQGVPLAELAGRAQAMMYRELLRQANALAYLANFRIMAIVCFCTLIAALLMRNVKLSKGVPAGH